MPIQAWRIQEDRVDFRGELSQREVQWLVSDREVRVLQSVEPVPLPTWELLNAEFFPLRPEVQLRVYGYPQGGCDLSFTRVMKNVRHFSADCLMDAIHVEDLAEMADLESLGVGVYHLESLDFLWQVTPYLKTLFLGWTKSKKPDLAPLSHFTALEELYLEGHRKNIDVLSRLRSLRDVTLRSISTPDLSYLKPLDLLESLDIKLGGIKDFSAISGMENLKYLELWRISGLADLSFISSLYGLQNLFLEALTQVKGLPPLEQLVKLRRVYLLSLKGLNDIRSLEHAPALEEVALSFLESLLPQDFVPLLRNPSLKRLSAWMGSKGKQQRLEALAQEYGIKVQQGLGELKAA
jgi:hypothetical protein